MYTVQCIGYSVHYSLYPTAVWSCLPCDQYYNLLHSVHCTVHIVQCDQCYNVFYSVQCTLYTVQCDQCNNWLHDQCSVDNSAPGGGTVIILTQWLYLYTVIILTVQYSTVQYSDHINTASPWPPLNCSVINSTALHWNELHCTVLNCIALNCNVLNCNELDCTELHWR